jgi:hypothetical protein
MNSPENARLALRRPQELVPQPEAGDSLEVYSRSDDRQSRRDGKAGVWTTICSWGPSHVPPRDSRPHAGSARSSRSATPSSCWTGTPHVMLPPGLKVKDLGVGERLTITVTRKSGRWTAERIQRGPV